METYFWRGFDSSGSDCTIVKLPQGEFWLATVTKRTERGVSVKKIQLSGWAGVQAAMTVLLSPQATWEQVFFEPKS